MSDTQKKRVSSKLADAAEEGVILAVKATVFTLVFGSIVYGTYRARQWAKGNRAPRPIDPVCFSCAAKNAIQEGGLNDDQKQKK